MSMRSPDLDNRITRTILYYPTIALPEENWIKQALLYWDQIASIVPMRYSPKLEKDVPAIPYTPDIDYLLSEGVFRPFNPEDFWKLDHYVNKQDELCEELFKVVRSAPYLRTLGPAHNWRFLSKIHFNKVSYRVYELLSQLGLVKKEKDDSQWLNFETKTGLFFMSLLAKYLADVDAANTMPGTNLKIYESLIFDAPSLNDGFACLDVRYKNSLPIPKDHVPLSDIIEFKKDRRNRQALLKFRDQIDKLHADLGNANNKREVKEILASFGEKMELKINELTELLHEARIETVGGCFKTIINVKSPTIWGVVAVAGGHAAKLADIPLEWVIPGLSMVGAIEIVSHLIEKRNKKRAELRGNEFAYLYHAQQRGIV